MYKHMKKSKSAKTETYLHGCLYFTSNTLARVIAQMAEEEFMATGLSPTYAFLLMLVNEKAGVTPMELAGKLNLAPSTVTRLVDKLVAKGFVTRRSEGKNSYVHPTGRSMELQKEIEVAWKSLHSRYSKILGSKEGDAISKLIDEAGMKLKKQA